MNLKQILERLRNMKKHYYEEAVKPDPDGERAYGWTCRAAGVEDAIRLLEELPQDCPNCGGWIKAATESAHERNEMRNALTLAESQRDHYLKSNATQGRIRFELAEKLEKAERHIEVLTTSRAAAVAQEQRTRDECNRLRGRVRELSLALNLLYQETADYIRVNHLGDVHHNRSMQLARDVLANVEPVCSCLKEQRTEWVGVARSDAAVDFLRILGEHKIDTTDCADVTGSEEPVECAAEWAAQRILDCMNAADEAKAEVERCHKLLYGMRCVYCGETVGAEMKSQDIGNEMLKAHVEKCAQHPAFFLKQRIVQFKSLLDSAESLLCNCQPYAHTLSFPQDWVKVLKDWRDEKHRLSPDGPERWQGDSTISPEGKI